MAKIKFPEELRGGRIGKGWYEDQVGEKPKDGLVEIASSLLKEKIEEAFEKARQKKEERNGNTRF